MPIAFCVFFPIFRVLKRTPISRSYAFPPHSEMNLVRPAIHHTPLSRVDTQPTIPTNPEATTKTNKTSTTDERRRQKQRTNETPDRIVRPTRRLRLKLKTTNILATPSTAAKMNVDFHQPANRAASIYSKKVYFSFLPITFLFLYLTSVY